MNRRALLTSIGLSVLFLIVYCGTNQLTAHRAAVPSFYFAWERHIPFVPLMILPYMSIDLFFVAAPFLCDEPKRIALTKRVVAAILIAGATFLLMPLRFAFARPAVGGLLGQVFISFRSLDQPFNQFPSLHIALLLILTSVYCRTTRRWQNCLLGAWFILVGLSTLLTYQHHLIDVLGGAELGVVCIYFFPVHSSTAAPAIPNPRVGRYYLAAALALAAIAIASRPLGLLLLWPAIALATVAAAYFGLLTDIYRKTNGQLPLTTQLMLAPTLLGQQCSLAYYRRRSRPWDAVTDRLWIGRTLSKSEAAAAVAQGVTSVLDLTGEFNEAKPFRDINYHALPILDLTAPTPAQLDQAVDHIRRGTHTGIVYVHCKVGYSRTAAIVGAYLLSCGLADSAHEAAAQLRAARPGMIIRPEAWRALCHYDLGRPALNGEPRFSNSAFSGRACSPRSAETAILKS